MVKHADKRKVVDRVFDRFGNKDLLTQKKKLHIRIPQRQFMGESEELR